MKKQKKIIQPLSDKAFYTAWCNQAAKIINEHVVAQCKRHGISVKDINQGKIELEKTIIESPSHIGRFVKFHCYSNGIIFFCKRAIIKIAG